MIYLDGNSLGPPSNGALSALKQTAEDEWAKGLVSSWNDADWISLPVSCGAKIAAIIGVDQDEVIVTDSVSVNLFKLAAALWTKNKGMIAVDRYEFPTDSYIADGLATLVNGKTVKISDPTELLESGVSVLIKSLVNFKTAKIADISAWQHHAEKVGAAIIWDLSHAAGVLDLRLKADGVKYAVGCGYKFLNGGPGAPGFVYVDADTASQLTQPLAGWMGHHDPFDFDQEYRPAKGVLRFACGTPPILSLAALDASLDIFEKVRLSDLEDKAKRLGDLFLRNSREMGLETISPLENRFRGAHVSLTHDHAYAIVQMMIENGVIGDFRSPNIMRFGFSPLFLSYEDVWRATDILKEVIASGKWRDPKYTQRRKVT